MVVQRFQDADKRRTKSKVLSTACGVVRAVGDDVLHLAAADDRSREAPVRFSPFRAVCCRHGELLDGTMRAEE